MEEQFCILSSLREELSTSAHVTIPTNIRNSLVRHDIVLIEDMSVNIVKLTVSTNTRETFQAARKKKSEKFLYLQLISVLEDRGHSVFSNHYLGTSSLDQFS